MVALAGLYWGVGILALPDNLADFFAFMIVTIAVTWVTFFLIRLFGAPQHFIEKVEQERDALAHKLTTIGLDGPFSYDHADFKLTLHDELIDIGVVINFLNHGDGMIRWKIIDAYIEVDGKRHVFALDQKQYVVNTGQRGWFNYVPYLNLPFSKWPILVDVMFDGEYDNVPPVATRGTKKIVRYMISSPNQANIPAIDISSEER